MCHDGHITDEQKTGLRKKPGFHLIGVANPRLLERFVNRLKVPENDFTWLGGRIRFNGIGRNWFARDWIRWCGIRRERIDGIGWQRGIRRISR